jgi:hypothetical protein
MFTDKHRTFADLYVKSGLYLTEIVKRLYIGLADAIPDRNERLRHILENQIYGFAPSEIIYSIAKSFIFGGHTEIDNSNLVYRDLTELAKTGGDLEMKFDVVVGNPPYQDSGGSGGTNDAPLYHLFVLCAQALNPEYLSMIMPARWFTAGRESELGEFRE